MKDRLFDWPTVWRHLVFGIIPFLGCIYLYEHFLSEWSLGALVVILAAILPFIALFWLGYQHWKHSAKKSPRNG